MASEISEFEELRWAQRQRLQFIRTRLREPGWINRSDLIETFEISPAQAAKDFALFRRLCPDRMQYDVNRKAYVRATSEEPVRFLTRRGKRPS